MCGAPGQPIHTGLADRLHGTPGRWDMVRCSSQRCGVAWIVPAPSDDTLAQAYRDYYTHAESAPAGTARRIYNQARAAYLGTPGAGGLQHAMLRLLGALLSLSPHRRAAFLASAMWLPARPGATLLEVGCGNGALLEGLRALGWRCTGLEIDPRAVAVARRRGLDVGCGTLRADSFAPESFDAVVMSHVIEHVRDPRELLARCLRVLKPGGRLSLLTPNLRSFGHRRFGADWLHLDPPRHLHLFTAEALAEAVRDAGFGPARSFTTVRDARFTLGGSISLRELGRYRIGELPARIAVRGRMLAWLAWFRMLLDPRSGEEIVVLAERPGEDPR